MKSLLLLLILLPPAVEWSEATPSPFRAERQYQYPAKDSTADFQIFGNPAGGQVQVVYTSPRAGTGYLTVMDESGQAVSQRKVSVLAGKNTWKQTLPSNKSARTYLIQFNMDKIEKKITVFRSGGK